MSLYIVHLQTAMATRIKMLYSYIYNSYRHAVSIDHMTILSSRGTKTKLTSIKCNVCTKESFLCRNTPSKS